jgi:DNA-binding response OmpR family regulator
MVLLFIDDDPEDLELFCDTVKIINSTYTCIVAHNGKEGLDILSNLTPDIVFLDVNMPIMDGRKTLHSIRQQDHLNKVPVCILSTSINASDVNLYKSMGATACITKPTAFEELYSMLNDVLRLTALV